MENTSHESQSETHSKPVQTLKDGYGACYHRVYQTTLPQELSAAARKAMRDLQDDLNSCSPQALATFDKTYGECGKLQIGDEFQIHISGPWNGPVRVTEASDLGFHFVTLEGHMESGEIDFQLKPETGGVTFRIESMARSRDALVDLVYDKIPIAKLMQTEMWTTFCDRFVKKSYEIAGIPAPEKVETIVLTERKNPETGAWERI